MSESNPSDMTLLERVEALVAMQGGTPVEDDLLGSEVISYSPVESRPGINSTYHVELESGTEAFHKPFAGVSVSTAGGYGHHPDEPPMHECAAWRLADVLGAPHSTLVPECVLRSIDGEAGSFSRRAYGFAGETPNAMLSEQVRAAAFFDSLVAQQDRHSANARWDDEAGRLGLIDHGYAFACPGDYLNATIFVEWRWRDDDEHLDEGERAALDSLLASSDLHGLARILSPTRVAALRTRAERMLEGGTILKRGDF